MPEAFLDARDEELSDVVANAPKGMSLTQDAWRRLRRNRVAMLSLWTLIAICVLAFITPLLPLQPPDNTDTKLRYTEPGASPLWLHDFELETALIEKAPEEVAELEKDLPALEEVYANAVKRYQMAELELPSSMKQEERRKALLREDKAKDAAKYRLRLKQTEIVDTVQLAYSKLGYPRLGPMSRWMVQIRYKIFGDLSLNSLCGRDELGRDLLSRLFWGARISLIVGLVATIVSLVIGVTYGAVAGYFGGWVDNAMMRIVDVLYSVPFIFVVIFLLTYLGEEEVKDNLAAWGIDRITLFFFVVGAIYWLTMSRVVRGQVISLRNELFVESARSLGAGQARIIFLHLLPNLFSVVIVYLTLTIPRVMLFEAFLSFLGLGVEPPDVSWGLLANQGIQVITPVRIYWWLILFPSIALGVTLLALNFLGDGLRDALDPRLRDE